MMRFVYLSLATLLLAGAMQAQTPPEPQPRTKPRAGTIIENPNAGRIIEAPKPPGTITPSPNATGTNLAGRKVERFEAVGNASVASDTIRVYLGIVPGEPYDPAALQRNFLNLWQTGLFDDIRIETDNAPNGGIIVRAVVKERPRIGAVEYRGNKELNAAK